MKKNNYTLLLILFFCGCYSGNGRIFDKGCFPTTPQNFKEVNSSGDDYNSNIQVTTTGFTITFSTNRQSQGKNFDFISYHGYFWFDLEDGHTDVEVDNPYVSKPCQIINSPFNELGPYSPSNIISEYASVSTYPSDYEQLFYANDKSGNLDIYCINSFTKNDVFNYTIVPLKNVNTEFDEAYPTFFKNRQTNTNDLYFTSNRSGNFDIFRALSNDLNQTEVESINEINSLYDDKCPFIKDSTMVFVSNRPGGFGGFDLWYSVYRNNKWSEPINFGDKINTEYDEYRPIIAETNEGFANNVMIFSSNRPGGISGFDLYYVGVKK